MSAALRRRRHRRERDPDHAFATMTRVLTSREVERFADKGVNVSAYPMRAATVALHNGRFSLPGEMRIPDDLVGAFILPVLDESQHLCDLAAWVPATNTLATWQGCGWALGQDEFPAILNVLRSDGAIKLFRSPLTWLQSGRRGLVIIDPAAARWRLLRDGGPFIVEGNDHARDLDATLSIRKPRLLIPSTSEQVAA